MNQLAQKMLEEIVDKFQKMAMFEEMGNEEKAIEILLNFKEDEVALLETLAKTYIEIADIIREAQNEARKDLEKKGEK